MTIPVDFSSAAAQTLQALARTAGGRSLEAVVVKATRQGVVIRIDQQDFALNSPQKSPPVGATLTLSLREQTAAQPIRAQILAIDGRPVSGTMSGELVPRSLPAPAGPAAVGPASGASPRSGIELAVQPLTRDGAIAGPPVRLVMSLLPPTAAAGAQGQAAPLSAGPVTTGETGIGGTPNRMTTLATTAADGAGGKQPAPGLPDPQGATAPAIARAAGPQTAAGPPSAAEDPALGGSSSTLPAPTAQQRKDANLAAAPSATGAASERLRAEVIGRTSGGEPLLRVQDTILRVVQRLELPRGAVVELTMPSGTSLAAIAAPAGGESRPPGAMQTLIDALQELDRAALDQDGSGSAIDRLRLPQPDHKLAARLLQLFRALDDLTAGHAVGNSSSGADSPKSSEGHAVLRALGDLASTSAEPRGDDWRQLALPVGADPAQSLGLFHRLPEPDQDGRHAADGEQATAPQRAVFEMSFSHLGRCQLDALCQDRRFDLVIRSEKPLEATWRQEIADLFAGALAVAGLTGELDFRTGDLFAASPLGRRRTSVTI